MARQSVHLHRCIGSSETHSGRALVQENAVRVDNEDRVPKDQHTKLQQVSSGVTHVGTTMAVSL